MTHSEIKECIRRNMASAHLEIEDLRVQPDPFAGWRIAVVSSGFCGRSPDERKQIALKGLERLTIQWLDLLTPGEREWTGPLPIDSTLEDLPLWPQALARTAGTQPIVFPSDLDDDLDRPIVATFYSMRGGVGRSTALAYTGCILAAKGRSVLCVDMDLEAPGLTALFGKEKEIEEDQGLVSLLLALDQGECPDISRHILRVSETDELYCLPAGLPNANYARRLNFIDPEAWYREERNPLRKLIEVLSRDLTFTPDVILLDARTGLTPLSGPLLFDLADLAVIVFFPHPQARTGTGALARALLAAHTRRTIDDQRLTPEPRFLISPIPASKVPEVVQRYQHRAIEWIGEWLSALESRRPGEITPVEPEITHFVPYREAVATSDRISTDREIWRDYEPLAEWLERFLPTPGEQRMPVNLAGSKKQILDELEFSAGTAEQQEHFLETFVETELVNKALQPGIPLVLGRKGTGKTAIFRRLLEDLQRHSVVVQSPVLLQGDRSWMLSPDGFKAAEDALSKMKADWREFWALYTCLACYGSPGARSEKWPQPDNALAEVLTEKPQTELELVRLMERLFRVPQFGILTGDWLTRLDRSASMDTFLLFDGLDTGFGNTDPDRERRRRAIEGLLSFMTGRGDSLQNLRFKVFLREDIWRKLHFENKSHLYGRSVQLTWTDKADYFKVVIKQARRSQAFWNLVSSSDWGRSLTQNDGWSELQVFRIWNLLVGERMKGGKTAFTHGWVWNRLADGNDNRSPRPLLQLFREATAWERSEQTKSSYEKSIVRPRALSSCLLKVSEEALSALLEEFSELKDLVNHLRDIGRTPVNASDLHGFDEAVNLAREVGLLAIYEGMEDDVQRYKVPDLYRLGIGMTRKGQA